MVGNFIHCKTELDIIYEQRFSFQHPRCYSVDHKGYFIYHWDTRGHRNWRQNVASCLSPKSPIPNFKKCFTAHHKQWLKKISLCCVNTNHLQELNCKQRFRQQSCRALCKSRLLLPSFPLLCLAQILWPSITPSFTY